MAYDSVNRQWPEGTRDGRDLKPTGQEAMTACKRLYRKFRGRSYSGKWELTSGNRKTWYANKHMTIAVNPDEKGGGWHEIVHSMSHMVAWLLYKEGHGPSHAFIEKEMIAHVVSRGWHLGALRREPKAKPVIDRRRQNYERTVARIKRWEAKKKRANTALRKLARAKRRYEKGPVFPPAQV